MKLPLMADGLPNRPEAPLRAKSFSSLKQQMSLKNLHHAKFLLFIRTEGDTFIRLSISLFRKDYLPPLDRLNAGVQAKCVQVIYIRPVRPHIPPVLSGCFQCQRFGSFSITNLSWKTHLCSLLVQWDSDSGECNGPEECVNWQRQTTHRTHAHAAPGTISETENFSNLGCQWTQTLITLGHGLRIIGQASEEDESLLEANFKQATPNP
ncbi:hypothetical protein TNCV_4260101 [Trichonephila clavipes]|nr:hypothetical protein TNCV_4260101 [Trichonephila clavipes]